MNVLIVFRTKKIQYFHWDIKLCKVKYQLNLYKINKSQIIALFYGNFMKLINENQTLQHFIILVNL